MVHYLNLGEAKKYLFVSFFTAEFLFNVEAERLREYYDTMNKISYFCLASSFSSLKENIFIGGVFYVSFEIKL